MIKKILLTTLVAVLVLAFVTPAFAQCGGCGIGAGACGAGPVAYGAPQDCVATISCNIPATTMVPYQTCETVMQPVQYPVVVPVQSSVTVPTQVCVPQQVTVTVPTAVTVPQEVPVTTYTTTCETTAVPVQVPSTAYAPVTSLIPQTYTVPLGSCPAGNAPASGIAKAPDMGGVTKAPMGANAANAANIGGVSGKGY